MKTAEIKTEAERQKELEYDQYLFDIFWNDHIENQVQQMMEHCNEKPSKSSASLMTNELNPV